MKFKLKLNMNSTEFQQVIQHDYQESLVMTYVNISNKTFQVFQIENKAPKLLFTT